MSRLNAPLTAPRASPMAEVAALCSEPDGRAPIVDAPAERPLVRERQVRRVAELRRHPPVQPPLDADRPGELAGGRHDPRLDLDLTLRPIERREQARDRLQPGRQVRDDERVRAVVDLHVASRRQRRFLDQGRRCGCLGIAERERAHRQRPGVCRGLDQRLPRVLLLPERIRAARCGRSCRPPCNRADCRAG